MSGRTPAAREAVFKRRGWPELRATIGPVIAEGGSSFVHEARAFDAAAGRARTFVVKRARPGTERFFERERAACARFDHRQLVTYLGSAVDDELGPLLALEKLEANPLLLAHRAEARSAFRDPGSLYYPLPPGVALELGFDLLLALEHLHAHGCIHADVKLANFMIRTTESSAGTPREARAVLGAVAQGDFEGVLVDLGSVQSLEWIRRAAKGEDELGPPPSITPIYAPPETVLDGGPIARRLSPSMDSYSFALVLYALLTGRAPYSAFVDAEEARHPCVLHELKTREGRGDIAPLDEAALDELPLHDVAFERGVRVGWPAFRSGVGHLLRRCTDPDPAERMDVKAARIFFERELGIRRASGRARAFEQRTFQMHPLANRLTGDVPLGRIRVSDEGEVSTGTPGSPANEIRKKPVARQIGRVLSEIRGSGVLPSDGPFIAITTGQALPDILASRIFALGEWLGVGASGPRRIRVGRSEESAIVLSDTALSREHIELERDAEGIFWVTDLGSANGTFVKGEALALGERVPLVRGARSVGLGPDTTLDLLEVDELEGFIEATLRGGRVSTRSRDDLFEPVPGLSKVRTTHIRKPRRAAG